MNVSEELQNRWQLEKFAVLTVRLGEREYFGKSDNNNIVIVFFHYKAVLVAVFGIETKIVVGGSLGDNALHFVCLWSLTIAVYA